MKKFFIRHEIALCFFIVSAASASTLAPLPTNILEKNRFRAGFETSYLQTDYSFSTNGKKQKNSTPTRVGPNRFSSIEGGAYLQYSFLKTLQGGVKIGFISNTVQITKERSNSSIHEALLELQYQDGSPLFRWNLAGESLIPFYSRATASQWSSTQESADIPLGDGSPEYRLRLGADWMPIPQFYIGPQLAYVMRTNGYASLLEVGGQVAYEKTKSYFARLGLNQTVAVQDDKYIKNPSASDRSQNLIGGSAAYNSINPEALYFSASAGYYPTQSLLLSVHTDLPLQGKNVPYEARYSLNASFEWGADQKTSDEQKLKNPLEVDESDYEDASATTQKNQTGFQEYTKTCDVVQANNQIQQLLISIGRNQEVKSQDIFEIFEPDGPDGKFGETVARAQVIESGPTRSKLQIIEKYKEIRIESGFRARQPLAP